MFELTVVHIPSTISASAATTSPPTRVLTIPFLRRGRRTINSIVDWTAAPTEAATRLGLGRKVPSVVISTAGRTSNLTGATKAPALTTVVTRRTIVPPPLFAPIAASPPEMIPKCQCIWTVEKQIQIDEQWY